MRLSARRLQRRTHAIAGLMRGAGREQWSAVREPEHPSGGLQKKPAQVSGKRRCRAMFMHEDRVCAFSMYNPQP
jgi:hypothetical protein